MDWLLNHLWVVVVIAGLIAKVFQAIRGQGKPGVGEAPAPEEPTFADPELAERTRKIREEIRRKIEERRGQAAAPVAPPDPDRPRLRPEERSPEATPPPLVIQLPQVVREVMQPTRSPAAPESAALAAAQEAEMMRQQALAGQLREIVERKRAVERRAAAAAPADQEAAALAARRGAVLDDLRDADALRRAFVLREILGPPVALR